MTHQHKATIGIVPTRAPFLFLIVALFVLSAASVKAQPVTDAFAAPASGMIHTKEAPVGLLNTAAPIRSHRSAGLGDVVLLTLGGVGGGLAVGAIAVAVDPPVGARVALFGLGVAAGTSLTGRLLHVDGAPLGALAGAVIGSGIVYLVAQSSDDGEASLADAASVALLALVVPPVLSTGGYLITPAFQNRRVSGIALHITF